MEIGKDADGHDFTVYGTTTANYLILDESANELDVYGTQEIQSTGKLQFRNTDKYIYSAAASTLDIVNAGTTTKTINITGNTAITGTTTLAGGNISASGTRHVEFRNADKYIYSSAASVLDIINAGTSTKTINISGTPVFQGGNISASGTRQFQFRATDMYVQSSAASTLSIVNARSSGSIRVGGTSHYAQFKEDGELTLTGNAQVKQEQWMPALEWDVTDTSACVSQLNSKYPTISINPSAKAAHVYIYGISPVPTDAATACNPTAWLELSSRAAHAGSTQFRLYWDYVALGETTGTTGSLAVNAKYTATNARESASVALVDHFVQADQVLWTLQTTGSGESGSNVDFWGMRVSYVVDRLGTPV